MQYICLLDKCFDSNTRFCNTPHYTELSNNFTMATELLILESKGQKRKHIIHKIR